MSEYVEEKLSEEAIFVEEEPTAQKQQKSWSEEVVVAGEDLVGFVKKLVKETAVRRLVIKNEKRHIHLEIPLALGMAGIAFLPYMAAVALIAALATDCIILVERVAEEPAEKTPEG